MIVFALVALVSWCVGRLMTIYGPKTPLDRLKNALLSHALAAACKDDISSSLEYGRYDGTKLPMPTGTNTTNACFTYITELTDPRHEGCADIAEGKVSAVLRYIERNLDTDDKVCAFFDRYIAAITGS